MIAVAIVLMMRMKLRSAKPTTKNLSRYMKDAPTEKNHVNLTFTEVHVYLAEGANDSGGTNLKNVNGKVDLAALTDLS